MKAVTLGQNRSIRKFTAVGIFMYSLWIVDSVGLSTKVYSSEMVIIPINLIHVRVIKKNTLFKCSSIKIIEQILFLSLNSQLAK